MKCKSNSGGSSKRISLGVYWLKFKLCEADWMNFGGIFRLACVDGEVDKRECCDLSLNVVRNLTSICYVLALKPSLPLAPVTCTVIIKLIGIDLNSFLGSCTSIFQNHNWKKRY